MQLSSRMNLVGTCIIVQLCLQLMFVESFFHYPPQLSANIGNHQHGASTPNSVHHIYIYNGRDEPTRDFSPPPSVRIDNFMLWKIFTSEITEFKKSSEACLGQLKTSNDTLKLVLGSLERTKVNLGTCQKSINNVTEIDKQNHETYQGTIELTKVNFGTCQTSLNKVIDDTCTRYGSIFSDSNNKLTPKNVAGLDKSSKQSSSATPGTASTFAMDGNLNTVSHTNSESNPWWMIDLGAHYFITEVTFQLRSSQLSRFEAIKIYLSKNTTEPSPPDYSLLPVFATHPIPPITSTVTFTGGMCGRFLIVQRSGTNVILEIAEMTISAI